MLINLKNSDEVKILLNNLSDQIIERIKTQGVNNLFEELEAYHDFKKSRLKPGLIEEILQAYNLTSKQVQIEFAVVPIDLSHQIHLHQDAYAVATTLGKIHGVAEPKDAYYYLESDGEQWIPLTTGIRLDVPPKQKHGFALKPGGICYFLTIQSPPTDREEHDDFVNVKGPEFIL